MEDDLLLLPVWRDHPEGRTCAHVLARRMYLITKHLANETLRDDLMNVTRRVWDAPNADLRCPPWERDELLIPIILGIVVVAGVTFGRPLVPTTAPRWARVLECAAITFVSAYLIYMPPSPGPIFSLEQAIAVGVTLALVVRWGYVHGILVFSGDAASKRLDPLASLENGATCTLCSGPFSETGPQAVAGRCRHPYHTPCAERLIKATGTCFECKQTL